MERNIRLYCLTDGSGDLQAFEKGLAEIAKESGMDTGNVLCGFVGIGTKGIDSAGILAQHFLGVPTPVFVGRETFQGLQPVGFFTETPTSMGVWDAQENGKLPPSVLGEYTPSGSCILVVEHRHGSEAVNLNVELPPFSNGRNEENLISISSDNTKSTQLARLNRVISTILKALALDSQSAGWTTVDITYDPQEFGWAFSDNISPSEISMEIEFLTSPVWDSAGLATDDIKYGHQLDWLLHDDSSQSETWTQTETRTPTTTRRRNLPLMKHPRGEDTLKRSKLALAFQLDAEPPLVQLYEWPTKIYQATVLRFLQGMLQFYADSPQRILHPLDQEFILELARGVPKVRDLLKPTNFITVEDSSHFGSFCFHLRDRNDSTNRNLSVKDLASAFGQIDWHKRRLTQLLRPYTTARMARYKQAHQLCEICSGNDTVKVWHRHGFAAVRDAFAKAAKIEDASTLKELSSEQKKIWIKMYKFVEYQSLCKDHSPNSSTDS